MEDSVTRYDGQAVGRRCGDDEPVAWVPVDQGKLRRLQANRETERQYLEAVMLENEIEPQAWKGRQEQLPLPMLQANFEAGDRRNVHHGRCFDALQDSRRERSTACRKPQQGARIQDQGTVGHSASVKASVGS